MIQETELREQVRRVLRSEAAPIDLYRWVMDRSWNIHKDSSPAAVELSDEVEAALNDFFDGVIDAVHLRSSLLALVPPANVVFMMPIVISEDPRPSRTWHSATSVNSMTQSAHLREVPA